MLTVSAAYVHVMRVVGYTVELRKQNYSNKMYISVVHICTTLMYILFEYILI